MIDLTPFQERFEQLGRPSTDLAYRLGWLCPSKGYKGGLGPDVSRVRRTLGVLAYSSHGRRRL
jgi:hypothetical protein